MARDTERQAREAGRVHRHAGIYASDQAVTRRRGQRRRTRELLACMEAVNELGQSFTLAELQELSVANPRIRRSELMVRISGFELIARELRHVAEFYTLSCPSRMHCRQSKTGAPVDQFDGSAPDAAQRYLRTQWQKARAKLHREGVRVYGMRVAEPHHDGTPHWHLLLFMPPEARCAVRETLTHYALEVDGDEPGAARHRLRIEAIDPTKGTAAGYVAKYVAKNIDGFGVATDTHGTPAEHAAERIDAWASAWRIRQFQQIGGPPVSVWRELRRAATAPEGVLDAAREAADGGAWGSFVKLMAGPMAKRADLPVVLAKVWSDKPSQYGEPKGYATFGVSDTASTVRTRIHVWTMEIRGGGGVGEAPSATATPALPTLAAMEGGAGPSAAKPPLEFCQ